MSIQIAEPSSSQFNNSLIQRSSNSDPNMKRQFDALLKHNASSNAQQRSKGDNAHILNDVVQNSGLSALADDPEQWHSVMSQTYGYTSDDQAYSQSEDLRLTIQNAAASGDWSGTGVSVKLVDSEVLNGNPAAFSGGDTQEPGDDQILVNSDLVSSGDISDDAQAAITEELFHAFERQIHSDKNGDTQLNGTSGPQFMHHGQGQELDEGALGANLLAQYNNGEEPTLSDDILTDPTIAHDDTGTLSNGNTVEFSDIVVDEPFWDIINDLSNDEINAWLASSEEGYADKEDIYLSILNSNQAGTGLTVSNLLERNTVNGTRGITEGVQDYIGWAMEYNENVKANMVDFLETRTIDFLNYYDNDVLSGAEADKQFNVDIWKNAPASQLLNLHNTREATTAVQDALAWKINNGETDEINAALDDIGRANFIDDFDLDQMDDNFADEFKEVLGPRPRSHDSISPLTVGADEYHAKYQPSIMIDDGAQPYTAVDADGNWNAGLEASGLTPSSGATSTENATVIARNADSTEAGLPDNITAIQYAYYFPKDQGALHLHDGLAGHRHDWEDVFVFVQDIGTDNEAVVGAAYSAHGDYSVTSNPTMDGDQVKVRYGYNGHLGDGWTHSFAEALPTDDASDYSDHHSLATYWRLSDETKATLNNSDEALENGFDEFGDAVTPMRDNNINSKAAEAWNTLMGTA